MLAIQETTHAWIKYGPRCSDVNNWNVHKERDWAANGWLHVTIDSETNSQRTARRYQYSLQSNKKHSHIMR